MIEAPEAIIENGIVVNADELKRYWQIRNEREATCRRRLLQLWTAGQVATQEIQPAPASQPWDQRQQYQIDQTRAELRNIKQKLFEMTGKKLEPGKTQAQPQKSNYKGLVVNHEQNTE